MLKLTLKPGDYINIGEDIRVVFSGGSANNIHLLIDAPRELGIQRTSHRRNAAYYSDNVISKDAQKEIVQILMREKAKQKR